MPSISHDGRRTGNNGGTTQGRSAMKPHTRHVLIAIIIGLILLIIAGVAAGI
jgi:hypothetical protein